MVLRTGRLRKHLELDKMRMVRRMDTQKQDQHTPHADSYGWKTSKSMVRIYGGMLEEVGAGGI